MLFARNGRSDSLTLEGRVLAPAQGIDESLRITVTDGVISAIEPGRPERGRGRAGLRRPARPPAHARAARTRRRSRSGTAAAAAGGYCAILAMPNTEPVVDSAAVLGALVERAREEAVVPAGFMAAISKGQRGEELTEMAELADAGAAAFTDDGTAVVVGRADAPRAAVQRASPSRPLALHCEEPTLSRGGHMHEGAVAAELGLGRYPSTRRERRWSSATSRSRPPRRGRSTSCTCRRASPSRRSSARSRRGVARDRRGDAAPPRASPTRRFARSIRT